MEENRSYRAALYESYVSGHQGEILEERSEPSFEADIVARVPKNQGSAILDVGCGQGQIVRLLETHGYTSVFGIDVSDEQVNLARKLGTTNVEQADVFAFSSENAGRFDVVLAVDLVEHFDRADVPRLFQTLAGLLKDGGLLILRTPNGASPYAGRIIYGDLTHGVAYTNKSLQQVAAQVGFRNVACYPARPAGNSAKQRVRRTVWLLIEAFLKIPLIAETGQVRGHIVTQNLIGVLVKS